jgi:hypothetical protein
MAIHSVNAFTPRRGSDEYRPQKTMADETKLGIALRLPSPPISRKYRRRSSFFLFLWRQDETFSFVLLISSEEGKTHATRMSPVKFLLERSPTAFQAASASSVKPKAYRIYSLFLRLLY